MLPTALFYDRTNRTFKLQFVKQDTYGFESFTSLQYEFGTICFQHIPLLSIAILQNLGD